MARTRALDYDSKRRTILRRSAELFAQFGYQGTSITMIADACGVSKALLYHYYPDKEAVLFEFLHAHLEDLIATCTQAAASTQDPDERLFALAAGLLEAYRGADAEHQVQITSLKLLPKDRQEVLRSMERSLVKIFSDAIAELVPDIGNGPLLKPLTMSLFGMLNWHYLWFREGKGLSRDEYARLATRVVTAGAGVGAAAIARPEVAVSGKPMNGEQTAGAVEQAPRPLTSRSKTGKRPSAELHRTRDAN